MLETILYPVRCWHGRLHDAKREKETIVKLKSRIANIKNTTILYVLTPTHGNLGDHAITLAVENVLKSVHRDYIEITEKELSLLKKYNKLGYLNKYPIVVNGGGNIGTLWPRVEELFRSIISCCPDSKILCLPNTAFFEDSPQGEQEYEKSRQIYNSHDALTICAREEVSHSLLRKIHRDVALIPDMALLLNKCEPKQKRKGCILCLRTDRERTRTDDEEAVLIKQINRIFGTNVYRSDMDIGRSIQPEFREAELERKFSEFRGAELVVTDRLHGMIFAAITGTPCIVMNSKSPKVYGCYKWLEDLNYIIFLSDPCEMVNIYNSMPKAEICSYNNDFFIPFRKRLIEYIDALIG